MNVCKNIIRKITFVPLTAETKNFPICKDCKFFISDKNISIGKCKKFGSLELVTGEIEYKFAAVCRTNTNTTNGCGEKGLLFLPR